MHIRYRSRQKRWTRASWICSNLSAGNCLKHADYSLGPDRQRLPGHGRHPAGPTVRQPFLARIRACAVRGGQGTRPRRRPNAGCSSLYQSREGTLEWYCVDHWSRELGLDIVLLKEEVDHLIAVHPHVIDFLAGRAPRRQAHGAGDQRPPEDPRLQARAHATCAAYFDHVICSHDIGVPKEHADFWPSLHAIEPFDPHAPCSWTIACRCCVRRVTTASAGDGCGAAGQHPAAAHVGDFPAIHDFSTLVPGLESYAAERTP